MSQNENSQIQAGLLDFPREKLPEDIWLYEPDKPFPRLQPKLRSTILSEARHRLAKFGARLIGTTLYGGAATHQYHKGGDIDVALYIDWDDFKGDPEMLEQVFKQVEIPWGDYVLHLFVKPKTQQEQVEVADAYYDVMADEWRLPPYVYPKGWDPEVFFAPMIEMAEQKAEDLDVQMGRIAREWAKLKKAVEAKRQDPADPDAVEERISIQRNVIHDLVEKLVHDFLVVWDARLKMHYDLRKRYVQKDEVDRFERFQPAEVVWKYLDQAGYVEYLKVLTKAFNSGTIDQLLDQL